MPRKDTTKRAVGTIFLCAKTRRVLLNLRAAHKTHSLCWSVWGGMKETTDILPMDTLFRELSEEMGFVPDIAQIYPFDIYASKDGIFRYYTFVCIVDEEFVPELNFESAGYGWFNLGTWPKPMHEGARISFCKKKSLEKLNMFLEREE